MSYFYNPSSSDLRKALTYTWYSANAWQRMNDPRSGQSLPHITTITWSGLWNSAFKTWWLTIGWCQVLITSIIWCQLDIVMMYNVFPHCEIHYVFMEFPHEGEWIRCDTFYLKSEIKLTPKLKHDIIHSHVMPKLNDFFSV